MLSMAISRWVEENTRLIKSLSSEELKKQSEKALAYAVKQHLSTKGFDLNVFGDIFNFVYEKLRSESVVTYRKDHNRLSRLFALKLTIKFGSVDQVLAYLVRYEKTHVNTRQPLHDACLFDIPSSDLWNPQLWQSIVNNAAVDSPDNLLMRISGRADRIEKYLSENKQNIIDDIIIDITQDYEILFSNEWDKEREISNQSNDSWINDELLKKEKVIQRDVDKQFNAELRLQLQLPAAKLTSEQAELLRNETARQLDRRNNIEKEEREKWRVKLSNQFEAKAGNVNQLKQETVAKRLEKIKKIIAKEAEERSGQLLLPQMTDKEIKWLLRYVVNNICYIRAAENPAAAVWFFSLSIPEKGFNKYLDSKPCDDAAKIPDINIDGREFGDQYKDYYLKKLSPFEFVAATLGKETSCCQFAGGEGDEPTFYGITSPNAGFYVLYHRAQLPNEKDKIVAQSLAWRALDSELVLDSVESQIDFRKRHEMMLVDFFLLLAHRLTKMEGIPRVICGMGATPDLLVQLKIIGDNQVPAFVSLKDVKPMDYNGYRDSNLQFILADKELPFIQEYWFRLAKKGSLLNKALGDISMPVLSKKQINEFCDLLSFSLMGRFAKIDNLPFSYFHLSNDAKKQFCDHRDKINSFIDALHCNMLTIEKSFLEDCLIKEAISPSIFVIDGRNELYTPLHLLAWQGRWEHVKQLVEMGVDINANRFGFCPIAYNAAGRVEENIIYKPDLDLLKWMIDHGADFFVRYQKHESPFDRFFQKTCASWQSEDKKKLFWDFADYLVHHIDNVNVKCSYGKVWLLHFALEHGKFELAKYMLENKQADVSVESKVGISDKATKTTAQYAAEQGSIEMMDYLIKAGADIYKKDSSGRSVFYYAAEKGHFELIEWLLKHYQFNLTEESYLSVLHIAVEKGHFKLAKYLIDVHGMDPLKHNEEDQTLIQLAAAAIGIQKENIPDMLAFLINKGVDPLYAKKERLSAFGWALGNLNYDAALYLVENNHVSSEDLRLDKASPLRELSYNWTPEGKELFAKIKEKLDQRSEAGVSGQGLFAAKKEVPTSEGDTPSKKPSDPF